MLLDSCLHSRYASGFIFRHFFFFYFLSLEHVMWQLWFDVYVIFYLAMQLSPHFHWRPQRGEAGPGDLEILALPNKGEGSDPCQDFLMDLCSKANKSYNFSKKMTIHPQLGTFLQKLFWSSKIQGVFFNWFHPEKFSVWNWFRPIVKKRPFTQKRSKYVWKWFRPIVKIFWCVF